MSKKDYVAIAEVMNMNIREACTPEAQFVLERTSQNLATVFAENPRFDRDRFLAACGVI